MGKQEQWNYFLKNKGEWQGSFTRLAQDGSLEEAIPSVLTLQSDNSDHQIRLVLRRFPPGQGVDEQQLVFPPLPSDLVFAASGAFSQGSTSVAPVNTFGAELSLIDCDRRVRLVPIYFDRELQRMTLIREVRVGTTASFSPEVLVLSELLGTWRGQGVTVFPDYQESKPFTNELTIEKVGPGQIQQTLQLGDRILSSSAQLTGDRLLFNEGEVPMQVFLLPGGITANLPMHIQENKAFILEVGWLIEPNKRQRLIRQFNAQHLLTGVTLMTETRLEEVTVDPN
ncbi:MAG: DUF3598 family protein [Cyanobacteria bacterium P01_H01_bin.15]